MPQMRQLNTESSLSVPASTSRRSSQHSSGSEHQQHPTHAAISRSSILEQSNQNNVSLNDDAGPSRPRRTKRCRSNIIISSDSEEDDHVSLYGDDESDGSAAPSPPKKSKRSSSNHYTLAKPRQRPRPQRQPRSTIYKPKSKPVLCEEIDHSCVESVDSKPFSPYLESCGYLEQAHMFQCEYGLCCKLCGCFIKPTDLETHLKRKGHGLTPANAKAAAAHILKTRKTPVTDILSTTLTEEIPTLGKPFGGYKCPVCGLWVGQVERFANESSDAPKGKARTFWKHGQGEHKWSSLPDDVELRYFYRPYGNRHRGFVLAFEEGWKPSGSSSSIHMTATSAEPDAAAKHVHGPINRHANYLAPGANFIEDMGFDAYISTTNASMRHLKQLVNLPNAAFSSSRMSARQKAMEEALVLLSEILEDYLIEASEFAGEDKSDIREAFVHEYVLESLLVWSNF